MKKILLTMSVALLSLSATAGTTPLDDSATDAPSTKTIFNESFSSSLGNFTIENIKLAEGLTYVWSYASGYGAKASGYYNVNNESSAWLVSPAIDLSGQTGVALNFDHALNFLSGNIASDYCKVFIGEAGTDKNNWTNLSNLINYPAGNNWTFVNSSEISLESFEGKTIQIGFLYDSTSSVAPTWEIKNLVVTAYGVQEVASYPNFKEYMQADPSTGAKVEGPITAVYQNGAYLYLKDKDGYFMLAYGSSETFENGDQISYVQGKYSPYNNLPEMTNVTFGDVTAGTPVAPEVLTVAEVASAQINSYIKLNDVIVNSADKTVEDTNGNKVALYARFSGVNIPEDGVYTVEGFVSIYREDIQIYPTSFTKVTDDIYINGKFNEGEVENAEWKLYQGDADDNEDNQYSGYFEIPVGEFSFCFQMGNKYLVPAESGEIIFTDNEYTGNFVESDTPANWTYESWEGGELAVLLDTDAKTVYFTYTPQSLDAWYIRGAFNNYNPNGSSEWALMPSDNDEENGIYTGTFEAEAGQLSFNLEDVYGTIYIPSVIDSVEMEFDDNEYTGYIDYAMEEGEDELYWTYPSWEGGVFTVTVDLNEGTITVTIEAQTDGVSSIGNNNSNNEVIFNLHGVKINRNQANKGIYIINGKKVVL